MKEIAVFGLGTLGKSLAISYSNMGGKVIAIDKSQEKVDEYQIMLLLPFVQT